MFVMQRKVIFLPVFIGAILCGCSSDSSDKNPVDTATLPTIGEGDDQGNPLTGFDPNTPYIDPVSGDTIAVPITLPASSGSTAIAPASSATAQAPTHQDSVTTPEVPTTTSSSAAQPESSSSGLKEYEDNHKAKASDVPPEGRFLFEPDD